MKMYMVAIFILGITSLASGLCPQNWRYFDKHCYIITKAHVSWYYARALCVRKGGQLAVIYNKDVNEFLKEQAFLSHQTAYWIGASDLRKEGTFRWEGTGQKVKFTDWSPSQPDNYRKVEDCAQLWKAIGYRWNDGHCHGRISFICQRKA